MCDRMARMANV